MSKVNEPMAAYYSIPQIDALKKRLKDSIERESNVEVLLQCESLMCAHQKYDSAYFEKMEQEYASLTGAPMPYCYSENELDGVIRDSERSGVVSEEEIKAFFARWKNIV